MTGPRLRLVVVLGLLVASFGSVSIVSAKAPPEPVCGVCTSDLDEAADAHGVAIERGQTTMTVQLYPNGSAGFLARVDLKRGAEALRNDTLRDSVVRDVSYVLADDRDGLATEMEGNTLVVRYLSHDMAHETFGVLRFDAFVTADPPPLASGGEGSPYPGADRLTLRAPDGFRVHGTHGAFGNDTVIGWEGNSQERYAGDIEEDVVITFVPEDGRFPGLRVGIAAVMDWVRSLVESLTLWSERV